MQNRKEKVHMNYEEFKERFIEEVKEKLAEQGYDMKGCISLLEDPGMVTDLLNRLRTV